MRFGEKHASARACAVLSDPAPLLDLARHDPRVRIYRPISEKIRAAS